MHKETRKFKSASLLVIMRFYFDSRKNRLEHFQFVKYFQYQTQCQHKSDLISIFCKGQYV